LSPVNLFPSDRLAGGCTRSFIRVHLLFPPVKVLRVLSSRTTRWKSARLHGGVMLQPLSAPLQNGLRFFQHPLPAIPSAFLADAPAPEPGRNVGFTMLVSSDTNELIPAFHTGSLECPCVPSLRWNNRLPRRFWPEPDSIFGSLSMTVPTAVHFCWTYHSACPSDHIDARSRGDLLAEISSSRRWKDVVSAASDPTVTSRAGADRLLQTEPQVRLTNLFSYRTITGTSSLFHTQALPLSFVRFLRLANGSSKNQRSPARRSRNGREATDKTSGEMSRVMSAQLPSNSLTMAVAIPLDDRRDDSQDNLRYTRLGCAMAVQETCETTRNLSTRRSRGSRAAVRATANATSCKLLPGISSSTFSHDTQKL
jgi:hypothetical protein